MSANTHQTHHTLKRRHTSLRFLTRFLSVQGIGLRFPLAWHPQLLSSNPYLQLHQNNCILSSEFSNQFSVQCIQFGSPLAKSSSDLLIEGVASYDPPSKGGLRTARLSGLPLLSVKLHGHTTHWKECFLPEGLCYHFSVKHSAWISP
jgi:hypothetical protein